jgi:methylenetetrahydrofolate dehydrogenase (NADP+)/methenyltetrahydrofolate cyclohydrolase
VIKYLNGADLAGFIKERHVRQVRGLASNKISPKLAIVQVKDDPVINTYVNLKQKYGDDIGVEVETVTITQSKAAEAIEKLNTDKTVHGIIVQLPLTDPTETDKIVNLVDPKKDVDALGDPEAPWPPHVDAVQGGGEAHTEAYRQYGEGALEPPTQHSATTTGRAAGYASQQVPGVRGSWFEPATPMAIMWLLAGYNVDIKGKKVALIGRGKLVGAPLEKILKSSGIEVMVVDGPTDRLAKITGEAGIIITAANTPNILHASMIKPATVIVDAGVAEEEGELHGNVAPDVYERDDIVITPKKGGVGPLTVCALFENIIRAATLSKED